MKMNNIKKIISQEEAFLSSLTNSVVFKCYSFNLYKKLTENGLVKMNIKPLIDHVSKKEYSIFEDTPLLRKIQTEYTNDIEAKEKYKREKIKKMEKKGGGIDE